MRDQKAFIGTCCTSRRRVLNLSTGALVRLRSLMSVEQPRRKTEGVSSAQK
jgi:hypothetical protein